MAGSGRWGRGAAALCGAWCISAAGCEAEGGGTGAGAADAVDASLDIDAAGDGGGAADGALDGGAADGVADGGAAGGDTGQDAAGDGDGGVGIDVSDDESDGTGDADADAAGAVTLGLPPTALPWAGVWRSNFGSVETIGAYRWLSKGEGWSASAAIISWSPSEGWLILQRPKDDPYNPSKFARVEVVTVGVGAAAFCEASSGQVTAAAALSAGVKADASDLDGKGCGGFPWTRITRPEPAGLWQSAFGGNERFDAERIGWAEAVSWDNATRVAISRNASGDPYFPGKYNRVLWTAPKDGALYTCTIAFGKDSAQLAAAATEVADADDLDGKGCGGFPWTRLDALAVRGVYATPFGSYEHVDGMSWSFAWLRGFDNKARRAIVQSPADDAYSPNQFSRVVWTAPVAGKFHFCIEVFGKGTAKEAEDPPPVANAADLDGKGCGGFPWTAVTPVD